MDRMKQGINSLCSFPKEPPRLGVNKGSYEPRLSTATARVSQIRRSQGTRRSAAQKISSTPNPVVFRFQVIARRGVRVSFIILLIVYFCLLHDNHMYVFVSQASYTVTMLYPYTGRCTGLSVIAARHGVRSSPVWLDDSS